MLNKHIVYVYGTLRPGIDENLVEVAGSLFNLGHYPGAILYKEGTTPPTEANLTFLAERVEVDDLELEALDAYEGYDPDDRPMSLYIRRNHLDGWIYEYNGRLPWATRIASGDWLAHTGKDMGSAAYMIRNQRVLPVYQPIEQHPDWVKEPGSAILSQPPLVRPGIGHNGGLPFDGGTDVKPKVVNVTEVASSRTMDYDLDEKEMVA